VSKSRLVVTIDGKALPELAARELWKRFSEHMDKNRSDMAGFARAEGFASVRPESRGGQAVLVISTGRRKDPSDASSR
jgi:hypothetical protein